MNIYSGLCSIIECNKLSSSDSISKCVTRRPCNCGCSCWKRTGASFEKVNEQLSLTVGIPRIITQEFDVMFGGGVILGEMLSSTVTR